MTCTSKTLSTAYSWGERQRPENACGHYLPGRRGSTQLRHLRCQCAPFERTLLQAIRVKLSGHACGCVGLSDKLARMHDRSSVEKSQLAPFAPWVFLIGFVAGTVIVNAVFDVLGPSPSDVLSLIFTTVFKFGMALTVAGLVVVVPFGKLLEVLRSRAVQRCAPPFQRLFNPPSRPALGPFRPPRAVS